MSASRSAVIKVQEYVIIEVAVPYTLKEAVLAAIKTVTESVEVRQEPSAPVFASVPASEETQQVGTSSTSAPRVRPASPADISRLARLPIVRASTQTDSTKGERPLPGDLAKKAPAANRRSEFKLGFVKGTPQELKSLATRVLEEMSWLIGLTDKPEDVLKSLEATSDKTTGNPNHWALVELSRVQEELRRQEEAYRTQMARFNAQPKAQSSAPSRDTNGWGRPKEEISEEERLRREAQSAAALAAKPVVIGQPNRQLAAPSRGTAVAGTSGSGSKKKRQGQKAKAK